ncbi:Na+/H+ antiporter NhaA [Thiomicrorhabdus immobilis]|nr:Na+/H+ antiporter NhaA [Thiomicrorhabdus immobilis]
MKPIPKYKILAPWERMFSKVATPFEHFLHQQTTTGLVLMIMTVVALILANSPISETYAHIFHTKLAVSLGDFSINHTLHHWINDGLMALFFFVIGLEIKREVLSGELSEPKNAILPILAAIGGVAAPALIYYYINLGLPSQNGWGIPMATDIAFAISALVLLGRRVPVALVTFLVALAIVDDLMAVTVIALFYTDQIHMFSLMMAFAIFGILIVFNRFGIHHPLPYFLMGGLMWIFMLESGVHATIAGILTALAIPHKPKFNPQFFDQHMAKLTDKFKQYPIGENHELHDKQKAVLHHMEDTVHAVQAPLNRLEHDFHLPVSLIVIPLFALANAGIALHFDGMQALLFEPVTMGVMAGLVLGKVIGIAGVAFLAIKMGIASMPKHTTMNQIFGVSFLGGIGFTMSIFIAELAWYGSEGGAEMLLQAKTGILFASLFAGVVGFIWLRYISKPIHPIDND